MSVLGVVSGLAVVVLLALGVKAYRSRGGSTAVPPPPSAASGLAIGQVATADDIGIKVVGAGAADPGRSEVLIRDAVERHFAELQQSYLTELEAAPDAEGVVTLHMTVAADGTVAYVRSTALGLADGGPDSADRGPHGGRSRRDVRRAGRRERWPGAPDALSPSPIMSETWGV